MISEKIKTYNREYFLKNKERFYKNLKKYKDNHPEKYKEIHERSYKKWSQTPKGIFKALKDNGWKNGRIFDLDKEEFIKWHNKQEKICYYCGKKQGKKRLSIDRKDNNLGYSIKNIALACDACNSVKGNILTEKEMLIVGKIIMSKKIYDIYNNSSL